MVLTKKNSISNPADNRNYGIDLLRLFAMFMVVILHTLGHGGVLNAATDEKSRLVWIFEIGAYCAVNCYAMISGYVSYSDKEKPYKYSKFVTMWLQVVFYSFGITVLWNYLGKVVVDANVIKNSLLPVSTSHYWYFSAYAGLFFMIPWINRFVRNISKNDMTRFVVVVFLVFSCYSNYCITKYGDVFKLGNGYTFVWLVIMYLIGAWLKKCEIPKKTKSVSAIVTLIICMTVTCLLKFFSLENKDFFVSYISPTVILMAICYVILFSKMKFNRFFNAIIKFFAPATFGVYLIHEQRLIRASCISNRFTWIADLSLKEIPVAIIGCVLLIFITCLVIEKIRMGFFSLLRINKMVEFVVFKLETGLKRLWLKIYRDKN